MSRGVIYVATGEEFVGEAVRSAESLKDQMPDIHVTLFADEAPESDVFDDFVRLEEPEHDFVDKIMPMRESPYDRTLFLDTDTYVTDDVSELFEMLDRFDLAASHAVIRRRFPMEGVPESFPEFNTGVIAFRNTEEVREVIERWEELYEEFSEEHDGILDQPAFRKAVYESDLDVARLTDEYNCRFFGPTFLEEKAKIIHGRDEDLGAMAEAINRETTKRVLTGHSDRRIFAEPKPMKVIRYPGRGKATIYLRALTRSVRKEGLGETLREVGKRFSRIF